MLVEEEGEALGTSSDGHPFLREEQGKTEKRKVKLYTGNGSTETTVQATRNDSWGTNVEERGGGYQHHGR